MTVAELIAALQGMPQDAEVRWLCNDDPRKSEDATTIWQASPDMVIAEAPIVQFFIGQRGDVMTALRRVAKP